MLSGIALPAQVPSPRRFARRAWNAARPVILAGFATVLLFASVDRTQPWSLASALLGLALLVAVLARQLGDILSLEERLAGRLDQLSMVSDIISGLNNNGNNVGGTLGVSLDRMLPVMKAEAGAIWLPVGASDELSLVEYRQCSELESPEAWSHLLERARGESGQTSCFSVPLPGSRSGEGQCLSVRLGPEDLSGFLLLVRRTGRFDEIDQVVAGAVGADLGGALRSVRMISEARKLADRDPVTSLLNHRSVYKRLHAELEKHQQEEKPLAVLMMDLDNFKLFNDTYGHPAGDEVLKRAAGVLRKNTRENDLLARYGGDEFMIILPGTSLKDAVRCAERIQTALERERFRCEDSCSLPIGFSYGVAVFPQDAAAVQELVATADANLYQSKLQGGNQITARSNPRRDRGLSHFKGFDLFHAMVAAIDNKDGYTRKHSEEVTEYSLEIARALGLDQETQKRLQVSGLLHDVGKIGIPDAVLRKPGKLTDEEFDLVKQHPGFGALIVGAVPGMEGVVDGVRHHHERWDGFGYPDRLAGEAIPLFGRIMAVADAFSAMTTHRPYRKGLTERQALTEIRAGLGTQFDPEIGVLFIRLREAKLAEKRAAAPRRKRTKAAGPEPEEPLAALTG